jgi:sugar phosphate isomerase/epimerase
VVRVNSGGKGATDMAAAERRCVESLRKLCDEGRAHGVAVIVENHGGVSADPAALARVIEAVADTHGDDAVGTLADFGNWPEGVDKYDALRQIMPYAKAVHAKVLAIDEQLNHPAFDLEKCVRIVRQAGYDGYLGIESEGKQGGQVESVKRAVRKLSRLV